MINQHSPPLELPQPAQPAKATGQKIPPARRRRGWIAVLILAVVAVGAYFLWPKTDTSGSSTPAKGAKGKGSGPAVVPVVAVKARQGDIGVYVTGLGTVTPINTVTVKSRVDGQLLNVRYKEGELVRQGDLLVEIDPKPFEVMLTQAEGQLAKDQAALANARVDAVRYEKLFQEGVIAEQQMTTQKALVGQDEGIVETDQGQVDSAKLNISYCHIKAPITGRIGLRLVDPGNMVHASDTNGLLVIAQIQPISAIFTIAEDQLPVVLKKMRAGQKLTVDAYDREMKNRIARGSLTTLDNQIDTTTGTLKLRATFDNQDNALFPNQFINARLLVEEKRGVTLAPTAAIQRNSQSTYVYVVKPDSTVTVRTLSVGVTEGDDSEITSGLTPGEVIVMTGVDKLQEGSKVNAQISGDNPVPGPAQNPSQNIPAAENNKAKSLKGK
jgi:membrane fusion protein, multidrug efflux system